MPHPGSITASQGQSPDERAGTTKGHLLPTRAVAQQERPVLPAGGLRRTGRLAALPLWHAARTAAAATRLSRLATDQVAARTAEQLFGTLGELKGGAAKLGQAMSVFEAAMPEEVAAPYRSALRRLTDAAPPMPAETANRVIAADLGAAFGAGWRDRLIAFDDTPRAAASIGQVHRGRWRDDRSHVVDVAVKVQYPGVGQALRSDLRQARLLARVMARLTRLNVTGLADELALRIIEELDYEREGRVQSEVAAAFADHIPKVIAQARAAGVREPRGRTRVTVPAVYAATPRVLITRWPFGQLAAAVLAGDGPTAVRLARQVGALPSGRELDERLVVELLHPMVATAAVDTFTYSRPWLRGLMALFTEPRFAPALRNLTPPREYALVWRATLSAAGLFAQLGATVPTRGFHLAYSPGFRDSVIGAPQLFPQADQAGRKTATHG